MRGHLMRFDGKCIFHFMADTADLTEILTQVLRQAPQWIRQDLASKEAPRREQAEEALAAMIANAVAETRTITVKVYRHH